MTKLLIIGECPNGASFQAGTPFVGRAGEYLHRMLDAAGLVAECEIVNAVELVLHRKPHVKEINQGRRQVLAKIESFNPDAILCLGWTATRSLCGRSLLPAPHSRIVRDARLVVTTFHPSYASRFRNVEVDGEAGTVEQLFFSDLLFLAYVLASPKRLAWCLQRYPKGEQVSIFNFQLGGSA